MSHELACSSFKPSTLLFENKTIFVTLSISNSNILQFFHHCLGTLGHQLKSTVIIWLFELVLLRKPVEVAAVQPDDYPAVGQARIVRLKVPHVLELALRHGDVAAAAAAQHSDG